MRLWCNNKINDSQQFFSCLIQGICQTICSFVPFIYISDEKCKYCAILGLFLKVSMKRVHNKIYLLWPIFCTALKRNLITNCRYLCRHLLQKVPSCSRTLDTWSCQLISIHVVNHPSHKHFSNHQQNATLIHLRGLIQRYWLYWFTGFSHSKTSTITALDFGTPYHK